MSYSIYKQNKTPDWLGILLSILVVLFLIITQCNQKKLLKAIEQKYINATINIYQPKGTLPSSMVG